MESSFVVQASQLFEAGSDRNRMHILEVLEEGEVHVGGICERIGLRQQAVSHHLTILKLRRLVQVRREGKKNFYSLTDEGRRLLLGARAMVA